MRDTQFIIIMLLNPGVYNIFSSRPLGLVCERGGGTLRGTNTQTHITAALKRSPYEFTDCYGRNFRLMFPSLLPSSQTNAVYSN